MDKKPYEELEEERNCLLAILVALTMDEPDTILQMKAGLFDMAMGLMDKIDFSTTFQVRLEGASKVLIRAHPKFADDFVQMVKNTLQEYSTYPKEDSLNGDKNDKEN